MFIAEANLCVQRKGAKSALGSYSFLSRVKGRSDPFSLQEKYFRDGYVVWSNNSYKKRVLPEQGIKQPLFLCEP